MRLELIILTSSPMSRLGPLSLDTSRRICRDPDLVEHDVSIPLLVETCRSPRSLFPLLPSFDLHNDL
jgi:hypothetical protein